MILSFPNHTGLEPGFKIIFSHPVPSSEGGDWTRALQAELTLLQAGKALASCRLQFGWNFSIGLCPNTRKTRFLQWCRRWLCGQPVFVRHPLLTLLPVNRVGCNLRNWHNKWNSVCTACAGRAHKRRGRTDKFLPPDIRSSWVQYLPVFHIPDKPGMDS